MHTADANREKLKSLCQIAGSYFYAAQLIAEQTQRLLSVDSIKAWGCDPATKRARSCPDWAVKALERSLKRSPKKRKNRITSLTGSSRATKNNLLAETKYDVVVERNTQCIETIGQSGI
jgi:hypothetical protein